MVIPPIGCESAPAFDEVEIEGVVSQPQHLCTSNGDLRRPSLFFLVAVCDLVRPKIFSGASVLEVLASSGTVNVALKLAS